jgi:TctA family transporter
MYVGNIVAVVLVLLTVPIFAALMRIPFFITAPLIFIICTVGAYSVSNSYLDVLLMLEFGIVGYLFKKLSYPLAPLVLAIVIGDKAEDAFRQAMLMSKGSLAIFFSNALVATLVFGGDRAAAVTAHSASHACADDKAGIGLRRRAGGENTWIAPAPTVESHDGEPIFIDLANLD